MQKDNCVVAEWIGRRPLGVIFGPADVPLPTAGLPLKAEKSVGCVEACGPMHAGASRTLLSRLQPHRGRLSRRSLSMGSLRTLQAA
jgi:hypothetical protein